MSVAMCEGIVSKGNVTTLFAARGCDGKVNFFFLAQTAISVLLPAMNGTEFSGVVSGPLAQLVRASDS
jgi:hypothetical protein